MPAHGEDAARPDHAQAQAFGTGDELGSAGPRVHPDRADLLASGLLAPPGPRHGWRPVQADAAKPLHGQLVEARVGRQSLDLASQRAQRISLVARIQERVDRLVAKLGPVRARPLHRHARAGASGAWFFGSAMRLTPLRVAQGAEMLEHSSDSRLRQIFRSQRLCRGVVPGAHRAQAFAIAIAKFRAAAKLTHPR